MCRVESCITLCLLGWCSYCRYGRIPMVGYGMIWYDMVRDECQRRKKGKKEGVDRTFGDGSTEEISFTRSQP